jgi:hypothetical protein
VPISGKEGFGETEDTELEAMLGAPVRVSFGLVFIELIVGSENKNDVCSGMLFFEL